MYTCRLHIFFITLYPLSRPTQCANPFEPVRTRQSFLETPGVRTHFLCEPKQSAVYGSLLRFPYAHVYVRFTKLVLIVRVTTYDLRQVTSPIAEVKRYRIVYSISRKLITLK